MPLLFELGVFYYSKYTSIKVHETKVSKDICPEFILSYHIYGITFGSPIF